MANDIIGAKIDSYAKTHLEELKQEENKTGKKLTKFDLAQRMLSSGQLDEADFAKWMSTQEGINAYTINAQQKSALQSGNIWGISGYLGGDESYLESLVSFSEKTPVEQSMEMLSPKASRLAESVAETKRKSEEMLTTMKQNQLTKQLTNPEAYLKEQAFLNHINSLEDVDVSYTELMENIKFKKADKKQQVEMLLKKTGEQFYEAKEKGDKAAMKELLLQGLSLTFAHIDNQSGITDIKDLIKKYSGLNALVDTVDKFVDDGDINNLSFAEKAWESTKGMGDAVDSFIGTQGAAFIGTLVLAAEAAAAAGIGTLFSVVTQGYFAYEGGKLVLDGAQTVYNADTPEEARMGGQELGTGTIMLGGAAKSLQSGHKKIVAKNTEGKASPIETLSTDKPQLSPELKASLLKSLKEDNPRYDHSVVIDLINKQPEFIAKLAEYKTPDGKPLFKPSEINDALINCKATIEANPDKIFAILDNPLEVDMISQYKSTAAGLWRAINEPLPSTIEANPQIFNVKAQRETVQTETLSTDKPQLSPELKASLLKSLKEDTPRYDHSVVIDLINKQPEFVAKLAEYKTPDGKQLFTPININDILFNLKSIVEINPEAILEILNNPQNINAIMHYENRAGGLWGIIYH